MVPVRPMSQPRVSRPLALVVAIAVFIPSVCLASASRLGPTFNASGPGPLGSKRTDVAYDPVNDVYLMVSGPVSYPGAVFGRFIDGNGNPLGSAFSMTQSGAHSQCPRVAYSAALGGFLVVWEDLRVTLLGQVWGRYIKFGAGGMPQFVTNDVDIFNPPGGTFSESTPVVGCAGALGECLVAWQQVLNADVHAIRVNLTGQTVGSEYPLSNDTDWDTDPNITYDPASGQYVLVHTVFNNAGGFGEIWAHRIKAGTGEWQGPVHVAQGLTTIPAVALNVATGQFLIAWWEGSGPVYNGRFMNADGTLAGGIIPLLAGYHGYDALSGAYNLISGTFVFVTHGLAAEDVAFQVSGQGLPDPVFQATVTGSLKGNYFPKIASHTQRAEWLMVTTTDFVYAAGQRISSTNTGGPGGGGGQIPPPPTSAIIDLSPQSAPNGSWFLAEGVANAQGNGFKTFYLLENPNPVPVTVRAYFSDPSGFTTVKQFNVPASSRTTVSLMDQVGAGTFGTVFQSLTPGADIDVERSIFWGPNLKGSTDATAVKTPNNVWYFAEGSRGGELFANYFLLFNPTPAPVQATGTYYRADGQVVGPIAYNLPPQARLTIDANAIPQLAGADFSATFNCATPSIVAERSMYWGGFDPNNFWVGGHATMGSPTKSRAWYFAEGNAAPNFESFFLLLNPNPFPIVVNAAFLTEAAGPILRAYTIPANTRQTVFLNAELGNIGPSGAIFSTNDGSTFLAERSIYWGGRIEGSNTIGAPSPASIWDLPEGATTSLFDTYAAVMNPNPFAVTFTATVFIEGVGTFPSPPVTLPPFSRKTFNMKDVLGQLQQLTGLPVQFSSFSTRVQTTNPLVGVVVEHSRYWNFVGGNLYWLSGGASMGIPH
jgi:hypothetical protein